MSGNVSKGPFGEQLRQLRQATRLTQEQLAERAGLIVQGISMLERRRRRYPYPHTLQVLVTALGLSVEEQAVLAAIVSRRSAVPSIPVQSSRPLCLPHTPTRPRRGYSGSGYVCLGVKSEKHGGDLVNDHRQQME